MCPSYLGMTLVNATLSNPKFRVNKIGNSHRGRSEPFCQISRLTASLQCDNSNPRERPVPDRRGRNSMRWAIGLVFVLFIAGATPHAYAGAAAETAGSVLAKVNKLPPDQRQKTLIE